MKLDAFAADGCDTFPCSRIFPLHVDPENRTVRATTLSTIAGAGGGGNGAVSSVELLDFQLGVIASGTTEVGYACCRSGVPRYVRVTVQDPALGKIVLGTGSYGTTGGVERGLAVINADEIPMLIKFFPYYGWSIGAVLAIVLVIVARM